MKQPQCNIDSGFSLLEVLVAIIVVTFFSAAAMQMMVISATFKARAKEFTTATNLIQENLESIRNAAAQYVFPAVVIDNNGTTIEPPNPQGDTTIKLTSVDGFTTTDKVQFTGTPDVYTGITVDEQEKTITIPSPGLITRIKKVRENGRNAVLVNNTLCSGGNGGLAAQLQEKTETSFASPTPQSFPSGLTASNKTPGSENYNQLPSDYADYKAVSGYNPYTTNTGKKLWVMRKDEPVNAEVLQIKYLVVKDTNGQPDSRIVAKLSSEVIPNAAYECIKQ